MRDIALAVGIIYTVTMQNPTSPVTMGKLTITVLVENSSDREQLTARHGLSFFIETKNKKILLDAGQDDTFARNAAILKKDLCAVDFAVVSHPHYDHAGGINTFCTINTTAPVYTFWNGKDDYLSTTHCLPGETARMIGFYIEKKHAKRIKTLEKHKVTELAEKIRFMPVTVHSYKIPFKNNTLFVRREGKKEMHNDNFEDEGILVFEISQRNQKELVLFNSCSHNGVINSIESVKQALPEKRIVAYIGGFHFPWKQDETIASEDIEAMDELAAYIKKNNEIQLYSGHCTGEKALAYLADKLENNLHQLTTGFVIKF